MKACASCSCWRRAGAPACSWRPVRPAATRRPASDVEAARCSSGVQAGSTVKPIISVGDTLGRTATCSRRIPDGISSRQRSTARARSTSTSNHESSLVPFPFTRRQAAASTTTNVAARASCGSSQKSAGVLKGSYAIPSRAPNYQRFCSNFLAGRRQQGFERDLIFTNEEATGTSCRRQPRPGTGRRAAERAERRAGRRRRRLRRQERRLQVDLQHGPHEPRERGRGPRLRPSGRVHGRRHVRRRPSSQLYMLQRRRRGAAVWNDDGDAARCSSPTTPRDQRLRRPDDRVAVRHGPLRAACREGDRQDGRRRAATQTAAWVLEYWSRTSPTSSSSSGSRISPTTGRTSKVLYFADTGEPRAEPDATTGRAQGVTRAGGGPYMNGRLYKLALNAGRPGATATLSILTEAPTSTQAATTARPRCTSRTTSRRRRRASTSPRTRAAHNQPVAGATNARDLEVRPPTAHTVTDVAGGRPRTARAAERRTRARGSRAASSTSSRVFGPGSVPDRRPGRTGWGHGREGRGNDAGRTEARARPAPAAQGAASRRGRLVGAEGEVARRSSRRARLRSASATSARGNSR